MASRARCGCIVDHHILLFRRARCTLCQNGTRVRLGQNNLSRNPIKDAEAKPNLKKQDNAADHDTIENPFLSKQKRTLLAAAVANDVQCTPDEASDAIAEILENKAYSVVMVRRRPMGFTRAAWIARRVGL